MPQQPVRYSRCGSTINQIERAGRGAAPEFRNGGGTPRHLRREVLLVDDDVTFVETFGALLRLHGYAVIAEFTLPAALRYLSSHTPDVLITDLRLEGGDGWTLADYATVHQPTLPVVVVTGAAYVMETEEHYGRIPVFLKPFDPDALLSYLEGVFAV